VATVADEAAVDGLADAPAVALDRIRVEADPTVADEHPTFALPVELGVALGVDRRAFDASMLGSIDERFTCGGDQRPDRLAQRSVPHHDQLRSQAIAMLDLLDNPSERLAEGGGVAMARSS
jgi:hypothetical protein